MICHDPAVIWIHASDQRCPVHVCGAGINRMMITKSDSFARQFPKRWGIFFCYEIRTHPVPNYNHHMSPRFRRRFCNAGRLRTVEKRQAKNECAVWTHSAKD